MDNGIVVEEHLEAGRVLKKITKTSMMTYINMTDCERIRGHNVDLTVLL